MARSKALAGILAAALLSPATQAKPEDCSCLDQKVIFFSGHLKSATPREGGYLNHTGKRERIYNDGILEKLKKEYGGVASYVFSDEGVAVKDRPEYARKKDARVFVEVHHQSGTVEDLWAERWHLMSGYCLFVSAKSPRYEESLRLASIISQYFQREGFKPSLYFEHEHRAHGKKLVSRELAVFAGGDTNGFDALHFLEIPGVIIECGNIANPEEEALMSNETVKKRIAKAISDGVRDFLRTGYCARSPAPDTGAIQDLEP